MRTFPNSPTHRILTILEKAPSSPITLHKQTKTSGQSFVKWSVDILTPLTLRGVIAQQGNAINITNAGLELFYELERKSNVVLAQVALPRQVRLMHTEVLKSDKTKAYVRPGANDFLKCPSRIGNKLVYREDVNDYE
jgi:hypothetical protein